MAWKSFNVQYYTHIPYFLDKVKFILYVARACVGYIKDVVEVDMINTSIVIWNKRSSFWWCWLPCLRIWLILKCCAGALLFVECFEQVNIRTKALHITSLQVQWHARWSCRLCTCLCHRVWLIQVFRSHFFYQMFVLVCLCLFEIKRACFETGADWVFTTIGFLLSWSFRIHKKFLRSPKLRTLIFQTVQRRSFQFGLSLFSAMYFST